MPNATNPIEMVKSLVRFDTTSALSNLSLIDFVADYLQSFGISTDVLYNEDKTKANLFATIGPNDRPGIVLSGHTDVVPVEGQDWDTDPFDPVESNGKLFGRGTSDMKSFIGVSLALVPFILERDLKIPIHFAFSYDEEIGCIGVHGIIPHVKENIVPPALVIVGEPTDMKVVNAHKGIEAFVTKLTGKEAHSSATDVGVNAIEYAARLIVWLHELGEELKQKGDPSNRFSPPYTSVHVGKIKGGTALNIIPRDCSFVWEFRPLPTEDNTALLARFMDYADKLSAEMKRGGADCGIETRKTTHVPGLMTKQEEAAETVMMYLAQQNETHAVSYGTEAGIFQEADAPTLVCGPGNILQAHTPNEFIQIDQINKCTEFIKRVAQYASDPKLV